MTRLHVVDGTFELFRAHYAPRPGHVAPDGRDLKASVGVVASLLTLLGDPNESVTHLAVAFDNPIESFRNDLFAGYKTGAGIEPALRAQFDEVERGVAALGVVVWSMDRYEADDALASAATRFATEVEQVRILTPDKDLGQVLAGDRIVQVDRIRAKLIDEAALRVRRGIGPESIADWLALVGDTADGIPGLPGFGEKAASAVLARYGALEAIPLHAHDWEVDVRGKLRLATTFAERRDDALLYKRLATLVRDVELPQTLADLRWQGPAATWPRWCDEVGASDLLARVPAWC